MGDDENSPQDAGPRSAGNLELFFDLVFTFAMSQVTQLVLHDLSPTGFGRAALTLLAVWWAWVGYTWLINTFDTDNAWHEAVVIAAMAAMLVAAHRRDVLDHRLAVCDLLTGEIAKPQRQMRAQRREQVAAFEHALERRGIGGIARCADLRAQAPKRLLVGGGGKGAVDS